MTLAHQILLAAGQAWPAFVLVAGLLMIGGVAAADGLFEAIGGRLASAPLGPRGLLLALLGLVAIVTAILNLDTSVVFLTPVLVHAARQRGIDERPYLYGSVFMANAASLLLPGSNLTNLLVLRADPEHAATFAGEMAPAWIAACSVTAVFVATAFRVRDGQVAPGEMPPFRMGAGAVAAAAAAVLVVAVPDAQRSSLAVLGVGLAATTLRRLEPRVELRVLSALFGLTVALGTLARLWDAPGRLLVDGGGAWAAAGVGALTSIACNNLPAAVLLSARPPAHPQALLVGLDVGPNLAVTGSLSAFLWLRSAASVRARVSLATYSRLGLVLVPMSLALSLAALRL